jgi:hypothetical protein
MTGYESKRAAARDKLAQPAQEPWRESASDYERGFIDGMQKQMQMQSSVDKAVNRMAQPAQEPVAYLCSPDENGLFGLPTADKACKDCFPVYTTPPQRPWVGLTDEEIKCIEETTTCSGNESWLRNLTRSLEAKLKEKNT